MLQQTVSEIRRYLLAVGLHTKGRKYQVRSGQAEDCWGFWSPTIGIVVDPSLKGAALWRILLHEYGHALGLDHTRSGIMGRFPLRGREADFQPPTERQKKRWVMQIARLVLEKRGRNAKV